MSEEEEQSTVFFPEISPIPELQKDQKPAKRDPFRGLPPVSSSEAALGGKGLASRSEMKQIKKAGLRHEGKKVVTDDVRMLKSITIDPRIPVGDEINYYVEPIRIEYYIPKESRFNVETRYLFIPLIDPVPKENHEILSRHMDDDKFMDLILVMDQYPQHITDILESYNNTLNIHESVSRAMNDALKGDPDQYRTAFYLVEVLAEYEPTYASLEFLGDFVAYNLNWLIRKLNTLQIPFSASDKTVSYLIKMRNIYWEEKGYDYDERFEVLAALFYEQAFPNRGLDIQGEDYFYDIFDKKKSSWRNRT